MKFHKQTIDDVELQGKTVLFRPEYNVPVKDGKVLDDYRLEKAMLTLKKMLASKSKVVIICSLGRPKGKVVPELTLEAVANRLGELIGQDVTFVNALHGDKVSQAVKAMEPGTVLMLQNMRYDPGEEANDVDFAKKIYESVKPDLYVFDAFGNAHRAHASQEAITQFVPSVSGYLVKEEVETISAAVSNPEKPVVAIVGGVKLETKMDLLNNFIQIASHIVVGGAMANTFFKLLGYPIGDSLYDPEEVASARAIMSAAKSAGVEIFLPTDGVAVGKSFENPDHRHEVTFETIGDHDVILDYSQKSIKAMLEVVAQAKTIIWNGPIGMTEHDEFALGSKELAEFIEKSDIASIVGGGETASFIHEIGAADGFTHVSTGGGASLELMAGKKLPAVEALLDKN